MCGGLSFALLAGLYAERVGAINFVLADAEAAKRVMSHLKRIARALYSNPPVHGEAAAPCFWHARLLPAGCLGDCCPPAILCWLVLRQQSP